MSYEIYPVSPEDKFIEEAAEAIHAVLKAKRFGYFNHHPDKPELNNMDAVLWEIDNLLSAMHKLDIHMRELRFERFKEANHE